MTGRARFVTLHEEGLYTMTELCSRFGISRKAGYEWLARFREGGVEQLADQSRAPLSCPHRTAPDVEAALVAERNKRPHWGPKKLLPYLKSQQEALEPAMRLSAPLPSLSTAGDILKRHGLVIPARKRRQWSHPGGGALHTAASNEVWTADFKGEFRTRNGVLCYPLTVCDAHTRYLLACHGLLSTEAKGPREVLERLFAEFGLPDAIRTDNGTPFASTAIAGLSQLNIWWIKLGIQHQRITPAHPQENGRHERMHKTLKAETTRPPAYNLITQRKLFNEWQVEYNNERPHEALAQATPGSLYTASTRVLPRRAPGPDYSGHLEVRRVGSNGCIRWNSRRLFVSETLAGEDIALEAVDEAIWSVLFYDVVLARFNERDWQLKG